MIAGPSVSRRRFLAKAALAGGAVSILGNGFAQPLVSRWRAAIIGHTGRGDYGHELDMVFNDQPQIEVVAVADPVPAGRAKAAARCRAPRQYADYHEMLQKERPQLVAVAPRHSDQHHAMATAAIEGGAHVLLEKPFTLTLAEGDDILARAGRNGVRVAVAHQARVAPPIVELQRRLREGFLGRLVEIHAWGKQDARAGGEDLIVLGTHLFDLMRFFAGDAAWCSARVRHQGREAVRPDVREPTERIGPVLGDEIEAQYAFADGVTATFTSSARLRRTLGPWGMILRGESGAVRILMDIAPRIFVLRAGAWGAAGTTDVWEPIPGAAGATSGAAGGGFVAANRRVLQDWLQAIGEKREPTCSGQAGLKALEMALAVFASGLSGARVSLPLAQRDHPLR